MNTPFTEGNKEKEGPAIQANGSAAASPHPRRYRRRKMASRATTTEKAYQAAAKKSVVSAERVKQHKQMRFNPIRNLVPDLLVQQIDAFHAGDLREFSLTMEAIERRDDVIQNVAWKRKSATARRNWEVLTVESLDDSEQAEAQAHRDALVYFYDNLTVTNAVDEHQRGGFQLLVRQMMDAIGKGYAVHEIVWEPTVGKPNFTEGNEGSEGTAIGMSLTATMRFVPLWFFENRTGRLRFLKSEGAYDGEPLQEGAWMVTRGQGIMEACAIAYMFKRLPMQDWLHYCDKHGTPGIHAKTDADKSSEEWDSLVEALETFQQNLSLVTNMGAVIEKLDLTTTGTLPFPELVSRMDRALASLWRGADLSTISSGMGAGTGASLQGEESDMIEADDAQMVSETLQQYLDEKVIEFLFGPGVEPKAYIRVIYTPQQDIDSDIKIDEFLLRHGAPLALASAMQRYGRPMPDGDEPLLTGNSTEGNEGNEGRLQMASGELRIANSSAGVANLQNEAENQEEGEELLAATMARAMGVKTKWLAPILPLIRNLVAKWNDASMSLDDLAEFTERAAQQLPELFGQMDINALSEVLEEGMGTGVVLGIRDAIRSTGGSAGASPHRASPHPATGEGQ